MNRLAIISLLVLAAATYVSAADGTEWNYILTDTNLGPSAWATNFPQCAGARNSPINIVKEKTENKLPEAWKFKGWDTPAKWTALDEKYAIKFALENANSITTAGGNLSNTYNVVQFHFHWGSDAGRGSEHTIDDAPYAMEAHFVHGNAKFANLTTAIQSEEDDALAAVGFLFKIQPEDNPKLARIVAAVTALRDGPEHEIENTDLDALDDLFSPANEGAFYRYYGGLTTPGCQQIVKWTLFETPIGISQAQYEVFRNQSATVAATYGTEFYREVQSVGDRVVTNFIPDCAPAVCSASTFAPVTALLCFAILAKLL